MNEDTQEPKKAHTVKFSVDQIGVGRIFLDGMDISSGVRGVKVAARAGDLTIIELELTATVEIEAMVDADQLSGKVFNSEEITNIASKVREYKGK